MANPKAAAMPIWLLLALPVSWISFLACAIAFGPYPVVVQIALLAGLFSTIVTFVVVPAAIYALVTNPALRSFSQSVAVAFCVLPILGAVASVIWGDI